MCDTLFGFEHARPRTRNGTPTRLGGRDECKLPQETINRRGTLDSEIRLPGLLGPPEGDVVTVVPPPVLDPLFVSDPTKTGPVTSRRLQL